jgi:hypothetical protein
MMCLNDEFKLGLGNIPYFAMRLTPDQVKAIDGKDMGFYSTDGKVLFDFKDNKGRLTGEKIIFIIFNE